MKVIIRPFDPNKDSGLIYDSYPKGVFHGSVISPQASKSQWMKAFYQVVKDQLLHSVVRIACSEEDPGTILGYSITTGEILNFVYVKSDVRNQGIGTLLTRNKFTKIDQGTLTKIGMAILKKRSQGEPNVEERSQRGCD